MKLPYQTIRDWLKEKNHTFPLCLARKQKLSIDAWFDKNSCDFNLGWWSKILRSNVSCGQMSHGQMSLAVKCHLRSNVPRSNVTCGQMSRSQMSAAVKCHVGFLQSNVPCGQISLPPSAVKCHSRFIVLWLNVRGQMSRGQMILWS